MREVSDSRLLLDVIVSWRGLERCRGGSLRSIRGDLSCRDRRINHS